MLARTFHAVRAAAAASAAARPRSAPLANVPRSLCARHSSTGGDGDDNAGDEVLIWDENFDEDDLLRDLRRRDILLGDSEGDDGYPDYLAFTPDNSKLEKATELLLSASLKAGDTVLHVSDHDYDMGTHIAAAASELGLNTVHVVPGGHPYVAPRMRIAGGGENIVPDGFLLFHGFTDLVNEVGSPAAVVNGSSLYKRGAEAAKALDAAKSFAEKRAAVEDIKMAGQLGLVKRYNALRSAAPGAKTLHYGVASA